MIQALSAAPSATSSARPKALHALRLQRRDRRGHLVGIARADRDARAFAGEGFGDGAADSRLPPVTTARFPLSPRSMSVLLGQCMDSWLGHLKFSISSWLALARLLTASAGFRRATASEDVLDRLLVPGTVGDDRQLTSIINSDDRFQAAFPRWALRRRAFRAPGGAASASSCSPAAVQVKVVVRVTAPVSRSVYMSVADRHLFVSSVGSSTGRPQRRLQCS